MSATVIKINDQMVAAARVHGATLNRSATKQVEFWACIGKIAEENPDLNFNEIKDLLIGLEQVKAGMVTDYQFG
ncbi:MAG TPA: hypothetical protein VIH30_08685 [Aquirhabdus sp.]